jgi:hypothetical protein
MRIQGPLVIDVSLWDDHLNIQELIDGGVVSVIVGMYKQWDGKKYILNKNSYRLSDQVGASKLIMQAYYYYYPQNDPIIEANWFADVISQYPVKFAWADEESYSASMSIGVRSEQYRRFALQLATRFPHTGVYTAKWFIDEHAPEMNQWLGKYPAWVPHYGRQPYPAMPITWESLKSTWLPNYDIIIASGQTAVMGHQFTGDRCILPGVYDDQNKRRTLDVSVFTQTFIDSIAGTSPVSTLACPKCGALLDPAHWSYKP